MELSFLFVATAFLSNLTKNFRQILRDAAEIAFGSDSDSVPLTDSLPDEFFYFMVEYAFTAVEIEVGNGKVPKSVFDDLDLFVNELHKHGIHFASRLVTDGEIMEAVATEFERRKSYLPTIPWFNEIRSRLEYVFSRVRETASETE